ncbi:hypothetical protein QYF50_18915 [Paenibacillus vini]|uniref:hypothetical protein n=1 Tax=Paenibacillus vini TaxID=1476024 RepID=UPI0025B6F4DC|nr:hypothetical protein [Paenibacillus vini]MDN4069978.1 hypothetical protein [Paenibacillus vini]
MNGLKVFCANLKSGSLIVTDKGRASMEIYPAGSKKAVFKLNSAFDILAIRDLLNDAYPPEVFKHDPVRRV